MTIAELKESIEEMKIKEPDDLGKAYNNGLDFCLGMIDVYEKFREDEMTRDERAAISILNAYKEGYESAIEDYKQEPCDDAISREAVCKMICAEFVNPQDGMQEWRNAVNDVVENILHKAEQLPSVTLKPIECDVISRQAVLDGIEELKKSPWANDKRGNGFEYLITEALDVVKDLCIKKAPSVTHKSGKWITLENRFDLGDRVKCSECGQVFVVGDDVSRKYCPNCGARMESEDKE